MLVFVDDYSSYCVTYCLHSRTGEEVTKCFKNFMKFAKNKFPQNPIAHLRCDNALEYTRGILMRCCDDEGISIDPSCPYTPEQDDRAEIFNKKILGKSRCIMADGKIPKEEWPLALKVAEYILNRSPCRVNPDWRTPHEMYFGRVPDNSRIRVAGSAAYVTIPKPLREDKFELTGEKKALVGFTSNGYVLMDLRDSKLFRSCDVKVVESKNFDVKNELLGIPPASNLQPLLPLVELDHSYMWNCVANH